MTDSNDHTEQPDLGEMASYWDSKSKENARRHIAINHWESEEKFRESGLQSVSDLLSSEHVKISPQSRVLDLGAGIGRMLMPLAQRFPDADLWGVDVSQEMVDQGTERLTTVRPNLSTTLTSRSRCSLASPR